MKLLRLLVALLAGLLLVGGFMAIINSPAKAQVRRRYLHLEPPAAPHPAVHTRQTSTAKINAVTTGEIISNTLGDGDNQIHGLIYHDGFLWASTRTSPVRILKINPETLDVEDSVELDAGQNEGEDIVYANSYIWVILFPEPFPEPEELFPAQLIRVDPSAETLSADTAIIFDEVSQELTHGTSLEYAFGDLWVGGLGKIARVDITEPITPTYEILDYSALAQENHLNFFSSLTSSDSSIWGAMVTFSETNNIFTNGTVIKIDPDSPGDTYNTKTVEALFPDDTTFLGDHYYISSEDDPPETQASDLYKFANDLSGYENSTVYSRASFGTFQNPLDLESIWGVYVSYPITLNVSIPGVIKKFDLSPTALVTLTLPLKFASPSELAFDDLGNMYATTWQSPAGILKYPAPLEVSDLSVVRSNLDAVLNWSHSDGNAILYQVWRSADAEFSPGDVGSEKITEVLPLGSTVTYTDTEVVGDLGINYTYGVKAVNEYGLVSPLSNRATLIIYPADTTTSIDSNIPNPSELGQEVSISFSTISDIGTPTGVVTVTVTDGSNWCAGTTTVGWCKITFVTSGTKTLEATYSGDPYFNSSTSPEVTHTVNEPSEPWTYIHLPLVVR